MIKHLLLAATLILVSNINTFAKIWRVNNTFGVSADFVEGQAAVDAASNGDTIYFEPSTTTYASLTIVSKRLNIFTGSETGNLFGLIGPFATIYSIDLQGASGSFVSARFSSVISIGNSDSVTLDKCARSTPNTNNFSGSSSGFITAGSCDYLRITRSRLAGITILDSCANYLVSSCLMDEGIRYLNSFNLSGPVASNGIVVYNTMFINPNSAVLGSGSFVYPFELRNAVILKNVYVQNTYTEFYDCIIDSNLECSSSTNFQISNSSQNSTIGNDNTVSSLSTYMTTFLNPYPGFYDDDIWLSIGVGDPYGINANSNNFRYMQGVKTPLPWFSNRIIPTINSGPTMQVQFSAESGK
jgi:hypothetical protein